MHPHPFTGQYWKEDMSGNKNPTNLELEKLVEKAGVKVSVLETPDQIVCDDEWTEERELLAQQHLSKDNSTIPEFWQTKYEREAAKNWDKFYKRNTTNFYKDRYTRTSWVRRCMVRMQDASNRLLCGLFRLVDTICTWCSRI